MTLEKWIERFHSYNKGGMTRTEDNAWYLLCGVLMGMVLAFWFYPDIEFYRGQWLVMLVVLVVLAIVRREKDGKE